MSFELLQEIREGLISVLVAFVLVHVIAFAYVYTHRAMSYSVAYVRAMVLACIAVAVMVQAVGNSLAWGLGMFSAMSMLSFMRFRINLRDPRDLVFLFAALVIGTCAGARHYGLGTVGAVAFAIAAIYVNHIPFGQPTRYDAQLRFKVGSGDDSVLAAVQASLRAYCTMSTLVMLQPVSQGEASEYVYQVRMRREKSHDALVQELSATPGVGNLSLLLEDSNVTM